MTVIMSFMNELLSPSPHFFSFLVVFSAMPFRPIIVNYVGIKLFSIQEEAGVGYPNSECLGALNFCAVQNFWFDMDEVCGLADASELYAQHSHIPYWPRLFHESKEHETIQPTDLKRDYLRCQISGKTYVWASHAAFVIHFQYKIFVQVRTNV